MKKCEMCGINTDDLFLNVCMGCNSPFVDERQAERIAVNNALKNPSTTMEELHKLADAARVSIIAVFD